MTNMGGKVLIIIIEMLHAFLGPLQAFSNVVSCVSLRVAVQRSYLLHWQVDSGYLLNLHSLLTHSQTVGIKASTVPSVAFCAKSSLKVDKSRLSSQRVCASQKNRKH